MISFGQQTDSVVRICAAFKENPEIRTTNAEQTVNKKKRNVGAKRNNRNTQAEL